MYTPILGIVWCVYILVDIEIRASNNKFNNNAFTSKSLIDLLIYLDRNVGRYTRGQFCFTGLCSFDLFI